jgi:hypothetical protein
MITLKRFHPFFHSQALCLLLCLLSGTLPASRAVAQSAPVPQGMHFQGRLAKPDGTPVADTNAPSLTFRLYDAPSGGNRLWERTLANVSVRNGVFAVQLDFSAGYQNGNTFATVFGSAGVTPFLEIQVATDAPLTPRQPLSSVPYAFTAGTAFAVPDGSITGAKIASGAITGDKIAAGTIRSSHLETTLQQPLSVLSLSASDPFLLGSVPAGNSPVAVAVQGDFAYVADNLTGPMQIFDIRNPAGMVLRGSIFVGTSVRCVAVQGNYAYTADSGSTQLLRVIDISNPDNPVESGSVAVAGGAQSLAVSGNIVYVAVRNAGKLVLVNISNPASPVIVGEVSIASASAVAVSGSHAYVTSSSGNRLSVVDVSNPASPVVRGTVGTGVAPASVAIQGSFAYVLNQTSSTLQIFDVNNPASPTLRGSVAAVTFPSRGRGVAVAGNYAYVAGGNSFQQFDISNPAAPFLQSSTPVSAASGVAVQGNRAYVIGSDNLGIPALLAFFLPPTGLIARANFQVTGHTLLNGTLDVQLRTTLNSGLQINGTNTLELGAGISKDTQAGKIGYQTFSSALDIVGAGTSPTNRQVKIWAEGGLTSTGVVSAPGFNNTSDARYKTHIATFPDALDTILNLRGVTFDWDREQWKDRGFAEGKQIGFIAQEVEKILPELVTTDQNGYKSVAYANVVPVLVEAVKAQQKQREADRAEFNALKQNNAGKEKRLRRAEAENAELKARLEALETALSELKSRQK